MKYRAIWKVEGREVLVLPRSKKRTTFDSVEAAANALERRTRGYAIDTRGLVKDTEGNLVWTISL